ncbi:hypothetical protein L5B97_00515 [Avibacterium sp. 20-15]|nr:hypothetical protein [Avibacterium sp. 20-15]URL05534.1 hypothetical protein L4F93_11595 [Avibacterium sp. 20-132]
MPHWSAYTRQNGAVMIFSDHPSVRYHHDRKLQALIQKMPTQ